MQKFGKDRTMGKLAGIVMSMAVLLAATGAQATEPQTQCQQAKLKAQGKLGACLAKGAAGVVAGKADRSAECRSKFRSALAKADAKAAAAGTSCRFVDNGDETVSDLNTGLVWQKEEACTIASPPNVRCTGRTYNFSGSGFFQMSGHLFKTFLFSLNLSNMILAEPTSGCFTGHCDWRIPTLEELQGILSMEHCSSGACIDPIFGSTTAGRYWTISGLDTDPTFAWVVNFADGSVSNRLWTHQNYVRAVRGGL